MDRFVEDKKITDYLLRDDHPDGGSKSRFFKGRGFSKQTWKALRDALMKHPSTATHTDTDSESTYGEKRVSECFIETPDGTNPCIRTVWQEDAGRWRLISAYPFL